MSKKNNLTIQKVPISEVKANSKNPRVIRDEKFKKLVQSIISFPQMLEIRPIVVNDDMIILGGNMRLRACQKAGLKSVPIIKASELTEEQQREFIIKDNVGFGDWDWDSLANEWEVSQLEEWALDVPTIKNTEILSELKYEPLYYEPKEIPNIKLEDCVDFTKYNKKIDVINQSPLSDEQKEVMKLFAYRFIKIDFERVADFYEFNATEDEKIIIERLRLVLTDNGINGFIEDDLIKIMKIIEDND